MNIENGKEYTREEIEVMPHIGTVVKATFYAGNPPCVYNGLAASVKNGHGSTDYFIPVGEKFIWAHRN